MFCSWTPDVPDALKRAQLKALNRQVRQWTKKVRQPFSGYDSPVPQVGEDTATDPTKALVHALVKQLKEEPEEKPALETKTPANVKQPKPRNVLTPKPTPTPRRPQPKIPATPLSGVTTLPETKKFDRILGKSEKQFDLIKQKYDRLTNPYKDQSESGPPPKKKKKEKETLGKVVKRGLKKGLEEGAKQWLDFWDTVEYCMASQGRIQPWEWPTKKEKEGDSVSKNKTWFIRVCCLCLTRS